jgi:hypothetical protein
LKATIFAAAATARTTIGHCPEVKQMGKEFD